MYEGEPQPLDQLAVIHQGVAGAFVVQDIDGKLPPVRMNKYLGLYFPPGKHRIQLIYSVPGWQSVTNHKHVIELEARAGHTYLPRFENLADGKKRFWVDDKGPGYPVRCLDSDVYAKKYLRNEAEDAPGCP